MKYAQIKSGKIANVIILDNEELLDTFSEGFDSIVRIDELAVEPQIGWNYDGQNFSSPDTDWIAYVSEIITAKRKIAPQLLVELYATNTLAGITIAQSDALFDEYFDVIIRLREGAFPTAIYRLQQKTPSGFVTQELLDAWIEKIKAYA